MVNDILLCALILNGEGEIDRTHSSAIPGEERSFVAIDYFSEEAGGGGGGARSIQRQYLKREIERTRPAAVSRKKEAV